METRDIILACVMVISVLVFSYEWLTEFWDKQNSLIVLSSMTLVASLALLILSLNAKLDTLNDELDQKERSLRFNIQSLEEEIEEGINSIRKRNK